MADPARAARPVGAVQILVTDAQDRSGLAAIRCLRAAGYRVGATATSRVAPGLWSRDCSDRVIVPDPANGVEAFVAALERVLEPDHYEVLVLGNDETLYAVSHARERVGRHVTLGLPEHEVVMRALDKGCLSREAAAIGMPTPESRICEQPDEALRAAADFGFPVLVKGVRTIVHDGDQLIRNPTQLASDESELLEFRERLGTCIVQRREPGRMMSFSGVATDAGIVASVVCRYQRTFPASAGQASFLETIEPSSWLTEHVGALVRAIGWQGMFQLQLIESDGCKPMPIDFNPRLYGSMSIAAAAGVPLTALWCGWLLGERTEPVTGRAGVRYRMEDTDARHILGLARSGSRRAALLAALPRRHTTHAYFRLRDPAPLLARAIQLVRVRFEHMRAAGGD